MQGDPGIVFLRVCGILKSRFLLGTLGQIRIASFSSISEGPATSYVNLIIIFCQHMVHVIFIFTIVEPHKKN